MRLRGRERPRLGSVPGLQGDELGTGALSKHSIRRAHGRTRHSRAGGDSVASSRFVAQRSTQAGGDVSADARWLRRVALLACLPLERRPARCGGYRSRRFSNRDQHADAGRGGSCPDRRHSSAAWPELRALTACVHSARAVRGTNATCRPAATRRAVDADGVVEVVDLVRSFNEMLDRLEQERRESGRLALAAPEGERKRVAGDLHDEVGQAMTGVFLLLKRAPERWLGSNVRCSSRCSMPSGRASTTSVGLLNSRPDLLEHLGLASAMKSLTTTFTDSAGLPARMGVRARTAAASARRRAGHLPDRPGEPHERCSACARRRVWMALAGRVNGASCCDVRDDGRGLRRPGPLRSAWRCAGCANGPPHYCGAGRQTRARRGGTEIRLEVPVARSTA